MAWVLVLGPLLFPEKWHGSNPTRLLPLTVSVSGHGRAGRLQLADVTTLRDMPEAVLEPLTKPFNKAQADNGTRQRQQGEMDIQPSLETNS